MKLRIAFVAAVLMMLGLVGIVTAQETAPSGKLEIFSWWAGDEGPALEALVDLYSATYPDVEIVNATVTGGAGVNFRAVLKTRMLGGNPPDSFQVHAGQEMTGTWVVAGAGAVIVLLIFMSGLWPLIWPSLDSAEAEQAIATKGFNAALIGVIIAAVWQMSGYVMAIFTAGIRGIPDDLREAARVDGCTEVDVYRYVILPQLNPFVVSAMIVLGHISLKIFDLVFSMSGPDNARTVIPGILVYTKGFRQNSFATANATAVIMLLLVAVIIISYLWAQLRTDERRA